MIKLKYEAQFEVGDVANIFWHHQDGQEGQEFPLNGVFVEIVFLMFFCHPNFTYDIYVLNTYEQGNDWEYY